MQFRQNLRRFSFRPIVVTVTVLFALVLGLFGGYAAATVNVRPPVSSGSSTPTANFPGPDAQDRNAKLRDAQLSKDTTHGH
ncbi:MAG TPA: hypothetical protein VLR46_10585 [Candidatus Dormibacteraeota bacterium]|nr:hypothetical protein [Candidatus Dormibacteraeota bacterium]